MKNLITILFILSSYISVQAAHIIGGSVEYTINSIVDDEVDIDVTFHVYRDVTTGGAQFDDMMRVGLFGKTGSGFEYEYISSLVANPENVQMIDFGDLIDCVPAFVVMQSAEYNFNFSFNLNNYQDFNISYQRCCRTNSLFNILDGGTTGIAISLDLTRAGLERLGIVRGFPKLFPVSVLPSEENVFDFSIDDGLTKHYSLSHAQTAGGEDGVDGGSPDVCTGITPIPQSCPPPFVGPTYRLGSGEYGLYNEVTIDSITGEFVSNLSAQGAFLIAVKADSYENGELLSTVYQQFVQVVSMCDPNSVIEEDDQELRQEIYPVPAREMIYIDVPLIDIIIYDAKGTKIAAKSVFNSETGIDISNFSVGVYFLEGVDEKGLKITKRFVK